MPEKFADPDVPQDVVEAIREIAASEGPTEPWTLLDKAQKEGIDRTDARKALRGLKMSNEIVPAGDLTGEIRLVNE